jgi:branched-chain amino acid transport system permease protein
MNIIRKWFSHVPLLSLLFGALIAVLLERRVGDPLAEILGLPKIPVLFGFVTILKKPLLIPSTILYLTLVFVGPISVVARLSVSTVNRLLDKLLHLPLLFAVGIHLGLLYAILHLWSEVSAYRLLMVKLTLIAIMLTLSLNVINGYMGEFSCSHPFCPFHRRNGSGPGRRFHCDS